MLTSPSLPSLKSLASLAALMLCACAAPLPVGQNVPPPRFAVGDHWEYRVTDGLRRDAVSQLDVRVTTVDAGVATIRMVYANQYGTIEKFEQIDANGGLLAGSFHYEQLRRFSPPLKLYDYPIGERSSWRQVVGTFRPDTELDNQIMVYGQVQGRAPATVPAGTYDTIAIYRIMQLDDDEFWRSKTTRRDTIRYSPDVKGVVSVVRDADYVETRSGPDPATIRTEHTTTELLSFTPGK